MRRALAIGVVVSLGVWATAPARAQSPEPAPGAAADLEAAARPPVNHVLKATLFDQGPGGFELRKGGSYFFGDATPIRCTTACTLELEATIQMFGNSSKKNSWAICPLIDKSNSPKVITCPNQLDLPTDKSPVVGSFVWFVSLKAGAHTAQPDVIVTDAASIGTYHMTYRVYQP